MASVPSPRLNVDLCGEARVSRIESCSEQQKDSTGTERPRSGHDTSNA